MFQRDYILRLIEQLGQALIRLRDRILGRQAEAGQIRHEIRSLAREVGLDLDVARSVDPTTLRMLMSLAGDIDSGRCWLLAELLYLEALQAREAGDSGQAQRDLELALQLHGWIEPDWKPLDELPAVAVRMEDMRKVLEDIVEGRESDRG